MAVVKKVQRGGANLSPKEDGEAPMTRKAKNAAALDSATETPIEGQIEFTQSDSVSKLFSALVAFRSTCPNVEKDKQGYGYKYATLGNVINKTRDHLKKNGLAICQFPIAGHNALGVITLVVHTSGEWIRGRFLMPVPELTATNVTQNAGAAITYARRYALGAVLGIATDDDTDASYSESDETRERKPLRKRR